MKIKQTFWVKKALTILTVVVLGVGVVTVRGQSADNFDPNANGPVRAIVVQPDRKVLIGGDFTALSPNGGASVTRNHIARLKSDGTIDGTFDPNADGPVGVIVLQADGGILVGSGYEYYGTSFTRIGGRLRNNIARLDPRTGLADSFDPNADGGVSAITIDAGGQILVGGGFTNIGGQLRNHIARLHGNTGMADSFDPNADGAVRVITIDADNRILTGGDFSNIGGQERDHVARLNHNSGLADAFDPRTFGLGETIRTVVLLPDSTILSCGFYYRRTGMHRLDPLTGLILPTPNVDATVTSVGLRASGEILVGGTFSSAGGVYPPRRYVAEFDGTTFALDSFDPGANGRVYAMVLQPGGDVLIGGEFTTIGGQARNYIARLKTEPKGSFVIGDLDAVVGHAVYFWGSQWAARNHLSQGAAPSAFKGFANSIGQSAPNCGDSWSNDPGNSSGPPSSVPDSITVIASSSVTKSGPVVSGNNLKIVVVRTDPGYDANPSHPGTGTVVSVTCQ